MDALETTVHFVPLADVADPALVPGAILDALGRPRPARVALFVDRARAARPDFELGAENAAAAAELCRALEGIPLAIGLAAGRAHVLSPARILARGTRRLDLLVDRGTDAAPRHRTLRAALALSLDLVSPEVRASSACSRSSEAASGSRTPRP